MPDHDLPADSTFPKWIGDRALRHGDRPAVSFITDAGDSVGWTYAELWSHACGVAARLKNLTNATDGQAPRALLLYPPGIEFLAGFLGCQIAGWVPVPTCYPRPGREVPRLDSAARDCQPSAILGDQVALDGLDRDKLCEPARTIPHVATDQAATGDAQKDFIDPASLIIDPNSLALLQYTSGSTSEPKGVMVRHRNLMANLDAIRRGFQVEMQADDAEQVDCGVFWLPFFHDMGLIGGILAPLYIGGRTILMSPRSFLQRPLRWLQAISDHKAAISGAPNFAYQLAVDRISPAQTDNLDLSRWQIAFCGAEPVVPRTLQDFAARFSSAGFRADAFYPCYGLAEASLLAAGGDGPSQPKVITVDRESLGEGKPQVIENVRGSSVRPLVSCGIAAHQTEIAIVDPATLAEVDSEIVGEIWLRGASITAGYWNRDEENAERFDATISESQSSGARGGFCRTGDLGFMHDGELYVTGRLKDLIILRGRNLFPQDIETTVRETIGSEGGQSAAFAVDGGRGEALAIVAELPRRADQETLPELVRAIRRAVIDVHEVDPRNVVLVRQATVPLTSSGKVQRSKCREMFVADEIKAKYRYDRASGSTQVPLDMPTLTSDRSPAERERLLIETEGWMTQWLISRAGVDPSEVGLDKPFADYGLDSMTAVEMSGEIEDWSGAELTPIVAWNYPTVAQLSEYIVAQVMGDETPDTPATPDSGGDLSDAELEGLLDEIENLSEDEINHALADKRRS